MEAERKRPAVRPRISRLDRRVVLEVLGQAAQFFEDPERPGRRFPLYTYPALAKNLRRRRGLELSSSAIRRLVIREDPVTAKNRERFTPERCSGSCSTCGEACRRPRP